MPTLTEVLPVIIYILLIILIVVLIVFMVKAFATLKKLDTTIDDVNAKMSKLNGVFTIVDRSADAINTVTDKMVDFVSNGIGKLLKKRTKKEED